MKTLPCVTALAGLDDEIESNVARALAEDVGPGDLTAQLVPAGQRAQATVIAREAAVLCGTRWFSHTYATLDPAIRIDWDAQDGDEIAPDQVICRIEGPARAVLTGERTALNFLQLLSGVATKAQQFAKLVEGTKSCIVDTRKTLPGLRLAQKYAVACGGGANHRLGLYDAILIKENHILAAGSIARALDEARRVAEQAGGRCAFIEIEVETLGELRQAIEGGAPMILLDNMNLNQLREAVALTAGRAILEASGNVSLDTLRAIAETGVDRISIGALTKDVRALDLSLRLDDEVAAKRPIHVALTL